MAHAILFQTTKFHVKYRTRGLLKTWKQLRWRTQRGGVIEVQTCSAVQTFTKYGRQKLNVIICKKVADMIGYGLFLLRTIKLHTGSGGFCDFF